MNTLACSIPTRCTNSDENQIVHIMLCGMVTRNGDGMPLFTNAYGLILNTEAYIKCLAELVREGGFWKTLRLATLVSWVLSLCRDAVSIFYSPSRVGHIYIYIYIYIYINFFVGSKDRKKYTRMWEQNK